ncbi:MAG: hypothetical protein ACLRMX_04970 [Lachnospira eligens]
MERYAVSLLQRRLVDDAMGDDYAKLAGLTSDDLSEPALVSIETSALAYYTAVDGGFISCRNI